MAYIVRDFLNPPQDLDLKLWRYLTVDKLKRLLSDSAIWFARADMFVDKLEGSYGLENNNPKYDSLYAPQNAPPDLTAKMRARMREIMWWMRLETYISCWHINDVEFKRMWDEYTKGQGVCIQTTYRILKDELLKVGRGIDLGFVKYIDHDTFHIGEWDLIAPFFYKDHRQFEYENELRAVWSMPAFIEQYDGRSVGENTPVGYNAIIDSNHLIQSIILHPNATNEFEMNIKRTCELFEVDIAKIKRSELDKK